MTPAELAAVRQRIEHRSLLVRALVQAKDRRFTGEPIPPLAAPSRTAPERTKQ